MAKELKSGTERFIEALAICGIRVQAQQLPSSTRTAAEAAAAISCAEAAIAKSIVFRASNEAVLAVASGINRVDTGKLAACFGAGIKIADADFVREQTGFAIGGVPPAGHLRKIVTFIDEDLFQFDRIWAAAGGSSSVFETTAEQLLQWSDGTRVDLKL